MNKKYTLEIETQSELSEEEQRELLRRFGAQFEDGYFGLYWKCELKPEEDYND